MNIQHTAGLPTRSPASTPPERAKTPEEAAQQFETLLARQFVCAMTSDLFDGGFSGEDGPAWMAGQRGTQRDMLADILAQHLVDSGVLRLSDLLLRQWSRSGSSEDASLDEDTTVSSRVSS